MDLFKRKSDDEDDSLDKKAIDIVNTPEGYRAVLIEYSLETGRAKVSTVKPTTRLIGLSFDEKKRALRNLTKI